MILDRKVWLRKMLIGRNFGVQTTSARTTVEIGGAALTSSYDRNNSELVLLDGIETLATSNIWRWERVKELQRRCSGEVYQLILSGSIIMIKWATFFRLVTSVAQRKNSESPWGIELKLNLWPSDFRAPMLYHWATDTPRRARSSAKFHMKKQLSLSP